MNTGWYARNPRWKRLLLALTLSIVGSPLAIVFLILQDPGGLAEIEPTRETALGALALLVGVCVVVCIVLVYLFEWKWRRDPQWWMQDDDGDPDWHTPDVRG